MTHDPMTPTPNPKTNPNPILTPITMELSFSLVRVMSHESWNRLPLSNRSKNCKQLSS